MERPKRSMTADEAFIRLSSLCAGCEYCISDMRRKMRSWTMPDGAEDEVIARLTKDGFIDENRYASAFTRDKFRYNKWGWVKIQMELHSKGIAEDNIECARQELSDEDVLEMLHTLLASKKKTVKGRSEGEVRAKLFRFALSRGFTYEQAEKAMDIDD